MARVRARGGDDVSESDRVAARVAGESAGMRAPPALVIGPLACPSCPNSPCECVCVDGVLVPLSSLVLGVPLGTAFGDRFPRVGIEMD